MGVRKRLAAEKRKETLKTTAIARNVQAPTSPRKARVVSDLIRGVEVMKAINILHYNAKLPAKRLEKLLQSAITNWEIKSGQKIDEGTVYVKTIAVDSGRMLKRLRPAPQGRGNRIRKRSNHVTIILDNMENRKPSKKEVGIANRLAKTTAARTKAPAAETK
ncbi:MAG: 50S ribosomal protein L22 [Bacteroidetes bacterium]|jgi:large subunit ribosomal protein L22|nr:50S ribosomal protein L22 [Bacteroidota bacterium]MBK8363509.1 50S ribosomal protein L22 [Bacteroidota bacterium]MBK9414723.1 50S ribosomal protein L22 [Bacteroidota bacterium]MBL0031143.1 50S ribosomal protein L22 [Bacteroidota bacterium]MBP6426819.1 50S ribosomal protein L22 [Bacteroidia bacterium]